MPQEPAPETISQRGRPSFLGNITRLILVINHKKNRRTHRRSGVFRTFALIFQGSDAVMRGLYK